MDAVVDYEGLDLHEGAAAAAGSFLGMSASLVLVSLGGGPDEMGPILLILLMYATPIWLAGFLLIGLPAAIWIENRTPVSAPARGRYTPYAKAGAAVGAPLFLLYPLFLPAAVGAALGGKAGVELWRRRDRRNETTGWPPAA